MNPLPARVLIIEDEPDLREALVMFLHLEGFAAHGADSLSAAEQWLATQAADVLLLDLGLPDGDGLTWLSSRTDLLDKGVIITTARGDMLSRISGVKAGADVYLVKPVLPEEIASLIRNLMRRLRSAAPSAWTLNNRAWTLAAPGGPSVKLTHSEQVLMRLLAQAAGQAVPREALARGLGHDPALYDYRRLEMLVRRLRIKVRQAGADLPLETAHRVGYAFTGHIRHQGEA